MTNARICQTAIGITGMAALALVGAAPAAQADVTNNGLTVSGDTFAVGQTYRLTVTDPGVNNPYTVAVFSDNGTHLSTSAAPNPQILGGTATMCWTPTTTGTHHLDVLSVNGTVFTELGAVDVTVAPAAPASGSAALIAPLSSFISLSGEPC